jgi:protein-tyrosine-phosphatase
MIETPGAVLFVCNYNAIRSPMAEGLLKSYLGHRVFVDSVGVLPTATPDPFMIAVMDELGIDMTRHRPKSFDDLEDATEAFDLVVTLSPAAQHRALELTRFASMEVEYWVTFDPSTVEGSRDVRLDAYRGVRDLLRQRIVARFPARPAPEV